MPNRVVQHRPKREEAKARELSTLKKENNILKRTIKRLEKEIGKRITLEEETEQDCETGEPSQRETCGECNSVAIRIIALADKEFRICAECKARTRVA